MNKIGTYPFMAEPFHCDLSGRLFMGHLGNHLLNAADFHSTDRGFGMRRLNTIQKTWVLSRLAIEMYQMPVQYTRFTVETWIESAMRFFTNRNFRILTNPSSDQTSTLPDAQVLGYGRSIWAMIDTETRQPADLYAIDGGAITSWVVNDHDCPIAKGSRVKMSTDIPLLRTIDTNYNDVDINGHINSVKYIEHVLDLWPLDWWREHQVRRIDIAYVAEAHGGDRLSFYREQTDEFSFNVRIVKTAQPELTTAAGTPDTEVARAAVVFCRRDT